MQLLSVSVHPSSIPHEFKVKDASRRLLMLFLF
jgi:hypothetical protein